MDVLNIIIGITLLICLAIVFIYSSLGIKHAARFRYLSTRSVYVTVFYVSVCTLLTLLAVGSFVWLILL